MNAGGGLSGLLGFRRLAGGEQVGSAAAAGAAPTLTAMGAARLARRDGDESGNEDGGASFFGLGR
jgi:hypothetical protein